MVRERDVELEGFAFGGATRVRMTSDSTTWDPGEYIGQGRPWSYTVGNSAIDAFNTYFGYRAVFFGRMQLTARGGRPRSPPRPETLFTPRTYSDVTHFPAASGPSMTVFTNGRECTTLTGGLKVNSVAWSGTEPASASITLEQHCEGAAPALRGTYEPVPETRRRCHLGSAGRLAAAAACRTPTELE